MVQGERLALMTTHEECGLGLEVVGRELSAGRNSEILVDFLCENIDDLCMARNSGPLI